MTAAQVHQKKKTLPDHSGPFQTILVRFRSPLWFGTLRPKITPLERKALLLRLKVGGQGVNLRTCCYAVVSHSPQPTSGGNIVNIVNAVLYVV